MLAITTLRSIRITRGAKVGELRPVLEEWLRLMEDDSWGANDAPWWYNERASVGTLAGAFWRMGGWAFEEYATTRWHNQVRGRGRADISFGRLDSKRWYAAEAKQVWPGIGALRSEAPLQRVEVALASALEAARTLPTSGEGRVAIVFAAPRLPGTRTAEEVTTCINAWLEAVLMSQVSNGTALAWTFPERTRQMKGTSGQVFPGVLLAMKQI